MSVMNETCHGPWLLVWELRSRLVGAFMICCVRNNHLIDENVAQEENIHLSLLELDMCKEYIAHLENTYRVSEDKM